MKLSIVLPTYNEEMILGKVLDALNELIALKEYEAEIIVVDDGSIDRTYEVAKERNIRVVRHGKNRGYGASLKTGINAAKHENIMIMDSDGSYPIEEIPELIQKIDHYDMVVGARIKKSVKMSFMRKIPKYFLTKLGEYLLHEKIPDINSGLRIFKKSMYEKYCNILPDGFSFTLTITLAALSNNEKIKFVPVSYLKREGLSKIRPVYDTLNFLMLIIRTILYFNPIRILMPLGMIFIFLALVIAFHSVFILGRFLDVTVTLLSLLGVQLMILALIADLINRRLK
ncbi:glycosyltransferase family 2 protein [Chlamydiota bacterium]